MRLQRQFFFKSAVISRLAAFVLVVFFVGRLSDAYAQTLLQSETLSVAVASNFAAPLEKIARSFERESGHQLVISSGSSGKILALIRNGAPFEVFLSADQEGPQKLVELGLGDFESQFTYAVGKLALWSLKSKNLDSKESATHLLKSKEFKYLSIANPDVAPYGRAAQEVMQKLGVMEKLTSQPVLGENIAQTFQFVSSGNAELGFVALSQLKERPFSGQGSYWVIPSGLHRPLKQDAILTQKGRRKKAALEFMAYLKSPKVRKQIKELGYE